MTMKKQITGFLEVSGRAGSGKTCLALMATESVLREGKKVLYADPEATVRNFAPMEDPNFILIEEDSVQGLLQAIHSHLSDPNLGLIVLDNLSALFAVKQTLAEEIEACKQIAVLRDEIIEFSGRVPVIVTKQTKTRE